MNIISLNAKNPDHFLSIAEETLVAELVGAARAKE
jgi:hypothetical protein